MATPFLLFLIFFFMVSPTLKLSRQFSDCRKEKYFSFSQTPSRAQAGPFPTPGLRRGLQHQPGRRVPSEVWPFLKHLDGMKSLSPKSVGNYFQKEPLSHGA
jgi:hypothetical protein